MLKSTNPTLDAPFDLSAFLNVQMATHRDEIARQKSRFLAFTFVTDALMLVLAMAMAYWVRFVAQTRLFQSDALIQPRLYLWFSVGLVVALLVAFWIYRLYIWRRIYRGYQEFASIFHASLTVLALVTVYQFFSESVLIARGWLGLATIFSIMFVMLGRMLMRSRLASVRRNGKLTLPAIIIGANEEAAVLAEQLSTGPASGLKLIGFLSDEAADQGTDVADKPVLGPVSLLDDLVTKYGLTEVVIASSALRRDAILGLYRRYGNSDQVSLRLSSGLFEMLTTGLQVQEFANVPLIGVNRTRLSGPQRLMKSLLDISVAAAVLLVLSPLLIALAIIVKLDSKGPIIYRRRVVGLNGNEFDAFKIRTMHINGDEILAQHPELQAELAANHKLKHDPRITRIGNTLRKYSIDELPQLFNVLLGQMSLVGPRMITTAELEKYGRWALNLQTVRPGLTGLWQVSGRSDLTYDDRVRLDMYYIRNYSIWQDISILLNTIPVVLFGKGAY